MIVIGQNGSMEYRANPLRAAAEPQPSETPLPDDRMDTTSVTCSDGTVHTMPRQQYCHMEIGSKLLRHLGGALIWLGSAVIFYGLIFWGASISPPPPEPGLIYIPGHYIEYHDSY
jgi:hypothetical protein